MNEVFYIFLYCLWNLSCLSHLQYVSIWSTHIPRALQSHVALDIKLDSRVWESWFSKNNFQKNNSELVSQENFSFCHNQGYQGYALPNLISELYNLSHNPGIREPSTNLLACGIQYLDCSPETRPQLKILLLWKRGRTDRDSKSWSLLQFTLCHWNILAHLPFHVYTYLLPKVSNTNVHPPLYPASRILEWCTTLSIMSEDSYLLA